MNVAQTLNVVEYCEFQINVRIGSLYSTLCTVLHSTIQTAGAGPALGPGPVVPLAVTVQLPGPGVPLTQVWGPLVNHVIANQRIDSTFLAV